MILSVSRRTDIPAFYSDWFYNRIKEGFVYVRNPMNIHQVSKIDINSDVVDCIVFWTKNPKAMLNRIDELDKYNYYFQFTINPYNQQLELNVPRKGNIMETFQILSEKIGSNRVVWRYDPILLSHDIGIDYHKKYFEEIAKRLYSYTNKCTISFIDNYKKTEKNLKGTASRELLDNEMIILSKELVKIASAYNIEIQTCAEKIDLESVGIKHGRCIDNAIIEDIVGYQLETKKDKNQRSECGCIESIDIGEYNTCPHNCLYCYANFNKEQVLVKRKQHDPLSPLLIGNVTDKDTIKERCVVSFRKKGLFE